MFLIDRVFKNILAFDYYALCSVTKAVPLKMEQGTLSHQAKVMQKCILHRFSLNQERQMPISTGTSEATQYKAHDIEWMFKLSLFSTTSSQG